MASDGLWIDTFPLPPVRISPSVILSRPKRVRHSSLAPEPGNPTRPVISPRYSFTDTSFSIWPDMFLHSSSSSLPLLSGSFSRFISSTSPPAIRLARRPSLSPPPSEPEKERPSLMTVTSSDSSTTSCR